MKTLLLLRHAKSSWDDPAVPDHQRPLTRRGIKAARRIGQLMRDLKLRPELVLCSTAVRARETIQLVLASLEQTSIVEFTDRLYHCTATQFASVLQDVDESKAVVMLVGHNPGLEEFLSTLTGTEQLVPTGALARVEVEIEQWSQFSDSTSGRLVQMWRPRDLAED